MPITRRSVAGFCLSLLLTGAAAAPALADGEVNVYTYRQPALINPLFEAFTAKTGIQVRVVFAENGLVERLAQEGPNSPADLLLTADAGRLVEAANRGLAQPVTSPAIRDKIPANLRDEANQWFGLTMRARVIYASTERAPITAITYEELADPKWQGKLCMRPGNHPYNIALFAAMIAHKGEDATREWLKGVKANLAIKPSGNDRAQAKSVFAGECDLALANTYYMGKMLTNTEEPEQKKWAEAVKIVFPSSPQFGTHVNISGMMLTAHAPNKDNALKLMEFLAGDEAQMLYAQGNYEYPVNPAVGLDPIVKSWGSFTPDKLNVAEVAKHEPAAAKLIDEVGFND
ncbi:Fe(3+) ABC transporter substrate-binding protein [Aestuariivirga sp.]|jgi:iron(III) transport system substrate-binding protein|uniref:Fe(3+) ABC transporter substrate-binding protein n=1 Tax=Aestuariivirga sp. TaxID=2650926 RepID=UPI003784E5DB